MGVRQVINSQQRMALATLGGDKSQFRYEAWLISPISFSSSNDFADVSSLTTGVPVTLTINAMGSVPQFYMSRKFAYRGATPTSLNIQTMLKVTKDPVVDIIKPIQDLSNMAFPTKGKSINGAIDTMAEKKDEEGMLNKFIGVIGTTIKEVKDFAQQYVDVNSIFDNTFFLNIAPQLETDGVYLYLGNKGAPGNNPSVKMGPYIIKSVQISLGKLIISGGYPEKVQVDIGLEAFKTTVSNEFGKIFV